jgi:peptidoglycan biosynthesis protein MviN/MurJ (putative lipid II flippase)
MLLLYSIIDTILQSRRENPDKRTHPTLLLLLATCPLLFVRGLYGVMSGILPAFNYFNPHNYGETGFTSSFVISDSIMGTTMEWCCCTLLMLTYFTSLNDPRMADLEVYSEGDKDQSGRAVKA